MNDILQILLDARDGAIAADISKKFDEIVAAVNDSAKEGSLTIELKIKPAKLGMGGCVIEVELEHTTKMKRPELPVGKATFFLSREGKLSRDNPDQGPLFASLEKEKHGRPQ